MKTIFTSILIFLFTISISFASSGIIANNYDERKTELFEKIVLLTSNDLGLDTNNLHIYINQSKFNKNMTTEVGSVTYLNGIYSINIDPDINKSLLIQVFIHELVHIVQMQEKRFVQMPHTVWFEGKVYTNSTPYELRPYEKEAKEKTKKIYYAYYKLLK